MKGPIETTDKIVQVLIFDVAVKAGIASAISALPILGVTGIRQIFTFIVEKVAGLLYTQLSRFVVFSVIDFTNERDLREYEDVVKKLKLVLETPAENYNHGEEGQNERQLEIQKAKEEYKKRLASLIRITT